MTDIWLLTEEFNDYDQHGQYFVAAFKEYPTLEQLHNASVPAKDLAHVKTGGGRTLAMEDHWFHLRRYPLR